MRNRVFIIIQRFRKLSIIQFQECTTLINYIRSEITNIRIRKQYLLQLLQYIQSQNLIILIILIVFFTYLRAQLRIEYIENSIFGSSGSQFAKVSIIAVACNSLTDISRPGFLLILIQNQRLFELEHLFVLTDFHNSTRQIGYSFRVLITIGNTFFSSIH